MIVGIFLRNFKTYKSINYIPITDEDQFCGLVGNNGIGKSSVLEAIDSFFNNKPFKQWNYHKARKNEYIGNFKTTYSSSIFNKKIRTKYKRIT